MRGTGRGRCKVVMWCDRTRPVGCTTGCTTAVRIYGRFAASSSRCCTAVQLYACSVGQVSAVYGYTHASTAEPQLCTAVRGQKQFPFASWSFIASAMPRAVHIHDVGANADVGVAVSSVPRAPTDVASPRRHLQAHTSVMKWSFE